MSIPKLRFKADDGSGFPEWEEKRLGDIFGVVTDYVAAGSFADIANNVKYMEQPNFAQLIRTVDLKKNFKDNSPVFVDEHAFNYLWRVNLNKESIVMPNVGNVGEVYYIHPKMFLTQNNVLGPNAILLGTKEVTMFWASYLQTNNFQKKLRLIVSTGAQPKFNKTELRHIKIYRPCLEEQRKIASFLSTIDEIITTTQSELTAWEERKKGVMQKIFNREVRFKADDGSEFPEWEEKKFSEFTFASGRKNKENDKYDSYSITNTKGFVLQNEQFEGGNYQNADKSMYIIVSPKSFAYNPARINVGSIGYQNLDKDVIVSSLYEVFQTTDNVDDMFIWAYFQTKDFYDNVKKYSEGGVRSYFYYDKLCEVRIGVPSLPEQKKIADCLSSLDDVINQIQAELSAWNELKKGLLQQMFV